jgi:dihydrofolate synthase/folylpolyglutamate synthase
MNYQETIEYLYAALPMFHRIGPAAYKADLTNTIALCNLFDNPQKDLVCIHIAGTNGKGSVSHLLAAVFQVAGFKTGLYTSPHLKDFRERIRINGTMISEEWISSFVTNNRNDFEKIFPSFFELSTVMAFKYFKEQQTEIAIIETGLGGRLDSTNLVTPMISVITNIGFDHMNLLGNTLPEIAFEKAGIIKNNIPVVIGESNDATKNVLLEKASKHYAPIYFADENYSIESLDYDSVAAFQKVRIIKKETKESIVLDLDLTGKYQLKNVLTAYQTLQLVNPEKFNLTLQNIKEAFSKVKYYTGLQGRWQVINHNPLTICDTGHNEDGIKEVIRMIESTPHARLHFVLGVVNDKDLSKILSLLPKNATYYFCKADIPRGLDATELAMEASNFQLTGSIYESVKLAMQAAQNIAEKDDLVFIGGSTFTVAEII